MRLLRNQGIRIARRTVTKYRAAMGLLASSRRRSSSSAASRKYPGIRAPLHPLQLVAQVRRTLPVRLHLRALLARRIDAPMRRLFARRYTSATAPIPRKEGGHP